GNDGLSPPLSAAEERAHARGYRSDCASADVTVAGTRVPGVSGLRGPQPGRDPRVVSRSPSCAVSAPGSHGSAGISPVARVCGRLGAGFWNRAPDYGCVPGSAMAGEYDA